MACYHPLRAYKLAGGGISFKQTPNALSVTPLPCGRCWGCRLERARQWAIRCLCEKQLHDQNCFITLTYDGASVPGTLIYRDFQLFMKRLRKAAFKERMGVARATNQQAPAAKAARAAIRFYMAGEYGERFERPHFHACIFGYDFDDKTPWKKNHGGQQLYRSAKLEKLWPHGHSTIGELNYQTAAYTARYIMKKITGGEANEHYTGIDMETGEVIEKKPEFNKMSLKPGIGLNWLRKYERDVYPHGKILSNYKEQKPPKYFDRIFKKIDPQGYETMKEERLRAALEKWQDQTPRRLIARETVSRAAARNLKRNID